MVRTSARQFENQLWPRRRTARCRRDGSQAVENPLRPAGDLAAAANGGKYRGRCTFGSPGIVQGASMKLKIVKLKIVLAVAALAAATVLAQAQGAPPNVPKPTTADAQKVVQIVSADKAKAQAYCELAKIDDQMAALDPKKDEKKLDALSAQADALADKIGPEYVKLMQGLDQIDPDSAEGKQFGTILAQLDKLCSP
jgi:hypothetical protein